MLMLLMNTFLMTCQMTLYCQSLLKSGIVYKSYFFSAQWPASWTRICVFVKQCWVSNLSTEQKLVKTVARRNLKYCKSTVLKINSMLLSLIMQEIIVKLTYTLRASAGATLLATIFLALPAFCISRLAIYCQTLTLNSQKMKMSI